MEERRRNEKIFGFFVRDIILIMVITSHTKMATTKRSHFPITFKRLIFFLALHTTSNIVNATVRNGYLFCFSFQIRKATAQDVDTARKILLSEMMNPLSPSRERLLVAYDNSSSNENSEENDGLLGFGQIRPIGKMVEDREKTLLQYHELSSLFVLPKYRRKGVGTALVSELLKIHDETVRDAKSKDVVCLLTLRQTARFYQMHGFRIVADKAQIPSPLQAELAVGSLISAILGNDIICMVRE